MNDARAGIDWFAYHVVRISIGRDDLERMRRCRVPQGSAQILPPDSFAFLYRLAVCLLAFTGGGTFFFPFFCGFTLPVGSSISPFSLAR